MNEQVPETTVAAAPGNRAKVFVSYSRKDLAFAQMMVEALAERGFERSSTKRTSHRANPGRSAWPG